jgi:hypothetical protein
MAFGRRQDIAAPKELPVPSAAAASPEATEVFRAWIVDRGLQVSLQRGFDDPRMWGILLADVARHAARIYGRETASTEADALAQIRSLLVAELDRPTDLGTTDSQH